MNAPSIAELMGLVVLPGLLIVFLALIILILSIWVMGKIIGTGQKKSPQGNSSDSSPAKNATPAASFSPSSIPQETVAAISAAVAVVMEQSSPGTPFAITNVRRAGSGRPIWGFAGMQQNTRPF